MMQPFWIKIEDNCELPIAGVEVPVIHAGSLTIALIDENGFWTEGCRLERIAPRYWLRAPASPL